MRPRLALLVLAVLLGAPASARAACEAEAGGPGGPAVPLLVRGPDGPVARIAAALVAAPGAVPDAGEDPARDLDDDDDTDDDAVCVAIVLSLPDGPRPIAHAPPRGASRSLRLDDIFRPPRIASI